MGKPRELNIFSVLTTTESRAEFGTSQKQLSLTALDDVRSKAVVLLLIHCLLLLLLFVFLFLVVCVLLVIQSS